MTYKEYIATKPRFVYHGESETEKIILQSEPGSDLTAVLLTVSMRQRTTKFSHIRVNFHF